MRARIRKDMENPSSEWDNEWQEVPGPEAIQVCVVRDPKILPVQAQSVAVIAQAQGKDPTDTRVDLLVQDDAYTYVAVFGMSESDVSLALAQPWVSVNNDSQGT